MLVLQRKKGQTLMIGDNIKITVVDVTSDSVKLAIDAPRDIAILREELLEATMVNKDSVAHIESPEKMEKLKNLLNFK